MDLALDKLRNICKRLSVMACPSAWDTRSVFLAVATVKFAYGTFAILKKNSENQCHIPFVLRMEHPGIRSMYSRHLTGRISKALVAILGTVGTAQSMAADVPSASLHVV